MRSYSAVVAEGLLFIYLFIYLYIYLFTYLFIYSFIYLFMYLYIYLFIYLFIYLVPRLSKPGVSNRTKSSKNPIERLVFDWVQQSNKIEHLFCCEFDFRTNRTKSNQSDAILFGRYLLTPETSKTRRV